jgi:hypothetical protein
MTVKEEAGGIFKVLAPTAIAAVISFLNAVFSPFKGTIFVFDPWEPQASRTAVATSVVVIAVVVARNLRATVAQLGQRAVIWLVVSLTLLGFCAAIYLIIKSGHGASSEEALFWIRDIGWMLIYIITLVMAGVTVALALMLGANSRTEAAPSNAPTQPINPV